ncbi:MAG: LysR family transcriptional regulator, partial [Oscillospiraceae bacterium]|nr:LysR family transcriptional regulator [Oscillospiraceae bacterium]
ICMYNLNDYQVFFYVAECENMRKAALVLGLTPPTVSRIIHDLELELDCQLFTRSKHGVRLTNAGELLYARVKPALGILRTGENELRALTNMDSGRICIGTGVMTAQSFLIPKCLSMYCKKYPHISVYLSGVAGGEMEKALLSGDIDFAVMPSDIVGHKESDIEVRHLYKENSAAVVGKRFAQLSQRELSLEELAQYPLISMPEHYAIYAYYRELYKKLDVRFKPEIEVTAIDMQITAA